VQFYRAEEELAAQAGGYLLGAVGDGGVALVIGTRPHREALEAKLAAAGVDVARARADGDYLAMDAAETLSGVASGDTADPAGFEEVAGGLIRRATSRHRPVRVFGELVALLWQAGQVTAAIELEEMWTGLAHRYPFGLWCGYPAEPATHDGLHDAVGEVCRLHGTIVGQVPGGHRPSRARGDAVTLTREFPASKHAPGRARRFVAAALQADGAAGRADDAALVVTELATNAVLHARSGFTVTLTTGPAIRISVRDAGQPPARPLPVAPLHGLGMIAVLASRWGTTPVTGGKEVWAELPG